jgi:cytochrome c
MMLNNIPDKGDFTMNNYKELLREFDVKTEQELQNKLGEESLTLPCMNCHKEVGIDNIRFIDGNPYCGSCAYEYR